MTSFYICIGRSHIPSSLAKAQAWGFGEASWRSRLLLWEAAETTQRGTVQQPCQNSLSQPLGNSTIPWAHGHCSTNWSKDAKTPLKTRKNIASELGSSQSSKQIQNPLYLGPFLTADCSMARVKCIYVVGTFPHPSGGLGKISVIALPERNCCCQVRNERFHIYNSSCALP